MRTRSPSLRGAACFALVALTGAHALAQGKPNAAEARSATVRVPELAIEWTELVAKHFDPAWILPEELPIASEPSGERAVDLVVESKRWLDLRGDASAGKRLLNLGDIVLAIDALGGDGPAIERVLAELAVAQPALAKELVPVLREVLSVDALRAAAWDPNVDSPRDGLLFARPLTLEGQENPPWKRLDGSKLLQQACVLVRADERTIKLAENDYRAYPRRRGSTYEAIHPVERSYFRGTDARGNAFAALRLFFRCDLPFPFSDYSCELSILNRTGRDGALRCDIYTKSRDFLWLAGRDVFLPVRASDGTFVGTWLVRWFGFDLRGVPDGDDARRSGLRSSLGNLKLEAEALQRSVGAPSGMGAGSVPRFDVLGAR